MYYDTRCKKSQCVTCLTHSRRWVLTGVSPSVPLLLLKHAEDRRVGEVGWLVCGGVVEVDAANKTLSLVLLRSANAMAMYTMATLPLKADDDNSTQCIRQQIYTRQYT